MKTMVQVMAEAQRDQGARVVAVGEPMLQLLQSLQNHQYYYHLQNQTVPSLSEVALVLEQPLQGEKDAKIAGIQKLNCQYCSSC